MSLRALVFAAALSVGPFASGAPGQLVLVDTARERTVPVSVFEPDASTCRSRCRVAVFATGYRATVADYSFLLEPLRDAGFFVIGIQLDLASDAPMPDTGDVARDRTPSWRRGARSVVFAIRTLAKTYPQHDWSSPILIGHSQGGDVAAMLTVQDRLPVSALVTLDNRRVALPRSGNPPTLTFRSSDQPADKGVLPDATAHTDQLCVVRLSNTRHDDMNDHASDEARTLMVRAALDFLVRRRCP